MTQSFRCGARQNIAGKPFDEYCEDCSRNCQHINRDLIFQRTKNSGAEIISKKGATYYGVSMAVSRIVEAIICDEHSVLTVSSCLSGAYGLEDVALSLPCVITKNGIDRIINLCLSAKETADLRHSAKSLKDVIAQVYNRDVDTVLAGV